MRKKVILVLAAMLLMMTTGCGRTEKQEEGHSSKVITSGGEAVSAYRDGKDVTDERKALEEQAEDVISSFLNRDKKELVLYVGNGWNVNRGYSRRSVIYIFL